MSIKAPEPIIIPGKDHTEEIEELNSKLENLSKLIRNADASNQGLEDRLNGMLKGRSGDQAQMEKILKLFAGMAKKINGLENDVTSVRTE